MKTLLFQKFQRKNQNNALYRTKENHSSDSLILRLFNLYFLNKQAACNQHNSKIQKCQVCTNKHMYKQYCWKN